MAELVVVMAIFGILTSVTVYNYGKFNANIIMTNMAYEVALAVREAQVFSLGVRGSDGNFDTRYGVYFNIGSEAGSQNFVFFADRDSNGKCEDKSNPSNISDCSIIECVAGSECEQLNSLTRGIDITKLCVSEAGSIPMVFDGDISSVGECSPDGVEISEAAITFERPNPDALILNAQNEDSYRNIAILIEENNGAKRAIYIRENGQISVEFINN